MCIYCYDDPDLHKTLLPMVKAGMALRLVVDRRYFAQRTAYFQYPRLKALRDADADVMDASGDNGGNMHYKVVVLHGDGWAAAYHGGCNATKASRDSWESMVRFAEPAIVATFQSMCDECFGKTPAWHRLPLLRRAWALLANIFWQGRCQQCIRPAVCETKW